MRIYKQYPLAKSRCSCGHTGDGEKSNHFDTFQAGHGMCKVPGCSCARFTWVGFLPVFQRILNARKGE